MENSYIADIIDSLENDKCIILLGPDFSAPQTDSVQGDIIKLAEEAGVAISPDQDGLYQIKSKADRVRFSRVYREYIRDRFRPSPMHQQIAEIPNHLIVSLSPDQVMEEIFTSSSVDARYAFFNKKKIIPVDESPTSENPLVYNLFGSIAKPDSLILTQDDLFDFLFKILKEKIPLPQAVETCIKEAEVFLFLGFDFEQWYLRILLKLFQELYDDGFGLVAEPVSGIDSHVKVYYSDNFDLVFVASGLDAFVDDIHQACQEQEILRVGEEQPSNSILSTIRSKIKKNDIEEALNILETSADPTDTDLINELIQLSSRYNMNTKRRRLRTIDERDAEIELNKITESILALASDMAE